MEIDGKPTSPERQRGQRPLISPIGWLQRAVDDDQVFQTVEKVKIASLVRAGSPRSSGEDQEHVQRLVDSEWPLHPILVHRTTMRIIDGFHRVSAAICKGFDEIQAVLLDVPLESAYLLAVEANVTHGLPLSLPDRRAAAATIIQTHNEWSDRAIAKKIGLSAKTVCAMRRASAESQRLDKRVGRDGRVRPLSAAVGRQLAANYIASRPDASLREIADAVGISPGTVRDVRARLRLGEDPVATSAVHHNNPRRRGGVTDPRMNMADGVEAADVNPVLLTLSKDPTLRMNAAGRELLRWLHLHAVNSIDNAKIMDCVPDHCVEHLVELAARCSANWARIAHDFAQCANKCG